jgi:hypothetical protein
MLGHTAQLSLPNHSEKSTLGSVRITGNATAIDLESFGSRL